MATVLLSVIVELVAAIAGMSAWPLLIIAAVALAVCSGVAIAAWPNQAAAITVVATGLILAITLSSAWIISRDGQPAPVTPLPAPSVDALATPP